MKSSMPGGGGGGISISTGSARDRENAELQEMLQMDRDEIGPGLLVVIDHGDPAKWKNTPVAVSQAIKVLKTQQHQSIKNFAHIKVFLERLTKKVLTFMQTSDQELNQMKNKVTRDLATVERNTEDKLKQIRKTTEENAEAFEGKIDAQIEMFKMKIDKVEEKLAKVEETEVVMEFINQLVTSTKKELADATTEQGASLSARIDQLHDDHLQHEGAFGPDHEKYKTLKDYVFHEFESAASRLKKSKEEAGKVQDKNKANFAELQKRLDGPVTDQLHALSVKHDQVMASIQDIQVYTLTPLQKSTKTMDEDLTNLRERIEEVAAMAADNKKLDSMMELMESRIDQSIKKLQKDNLEDMEKFKEEMQRKSELDQKNATAAQKRKEMELEKQLQQLSKHAKGAPEPKGRKGPGGGSKPTSEAGEQPRGMGRGRGRGARDPSKGLQERQANRQAQDKSPMTIRADSQQDSALSPTPDGSQAPITPAQQTHTTLGDKEGQATVKSNFPAIEEEDKEKEKEAVDTTSKLEAEKKEELKTERQTKTDFVESTQKKKVPIKKPPPSGSGSALEGGAGADEMTETITLHMPSHIKDAEERFVSMKEEIQKHKREIEQLTTQLAQANIKQQKFETETDKKFADILRKLQEQDSQVHSEIQGAIRTASSWNKKGPLNQALTGDVGAKSRASARSKRVIKVTALDKTMQSDRKSQISHQKSPASSKAPSVEREKPPEPFDPQRHIQAENEDKERIQKEIEERVQQQLGPSQPIIHERSLETLAPMSNVQSDHKLETIQSSAHNISIYGNQPEPETNLSPQKAAAGNLGGMFAPLEVKYQDLKDFEKLAKKNFSGNKYPSISPREEIPKDDIDEPQPMPVTGLQHYGSAGSIGSLGSHQGSKKQLR